MANKWLKRAGWGLAFVAISLPLLFIFSPPRESYEYLYGTVEQADESVYYESTEEYPEFFSEKIIYTDVEVKLDNGDMINFLDERSRSFTAGEMVKVKKSTFKRFGVVEDIVYELAE